MVAIAHSQIRKKITFCVDQPKCLMDYKMQMTIQLRVRYVISRHFHDSVRDPIDFLYPSYPSSMFVSTVILQKKKDVSRNLKSIRI